MPRAATVKSSYDVGWNLPLLISLHPCHVLPLAHRIVQDDINDDQEEGEEASSFDQLLFPGRRRRHALIVAVLRVVGGAVRTARRTRLLHVHDPRFFDGGCCGHRRGGRKPGSVWWWRLFGGVPRCTLENVREREAGMYYIRENELVTNRENELVTGRPVSRCLRLERLAELRVIMDPVHREDTKVLLGPAS